MKKILLTLIVFLMTAGYAVAADTWEPIIGIPDPGWGISTDRTVLYGAGSGATYDYGSGPEPYRLDSNGDPYTHYIDSEDANCTDSQVYGVAPNFEPAGYPRCSRPNVTVGTPLPAGTVVYITGGAQVGYGAFYTNATSEKPVFFTGNPDDKPVWTGVFFPQTNYFIWENMKHDLETYARRTITIGYWPGSPQVDMGDQTNIAIRNCEFYNGQDEATSSYQVIRIVHANNDSDVIENVIIYKNYFHDINPGRTQLTQDDAVCVNSDIGGQKIWIINNIMEDIGGDAVQLASDMGVVGETYTIPNHIYIGNNTGTNCFEELVDMKLCEDVIVSQNLYHSPAPLYATSGGILAGIGDDPLVTEHRDNIWVLFNKIYDIGGSAIIFYDREETVWPTEHYAIGNIAYNIHNTAGDANTYSSSYIASMYWLNNTCYNVDVGMYFVGEKQLDKDVEQTTIVNNIIGDPHVSSANDYSLYFLAREDSIARKTITNNIFYNSGGDVQLRVGVTADTTPWGTTYTTYSNFTESPYPNFGIASFNENPDHVDAPTADFHVTADSPAVDKGYLHDAYTTFETRYGISIDVDFDSVSIGNPPDIGAYEYIPSNIRASGRFNFGN